MIGNASAVFSVGSITRLSSFFLLIQSSNETVSSLFVFFFVKQNCCVDTNQSRARKKKQCKCQKSVKSFRIKKVPRKRNVFDDVIGWLGSVCNNVLYLTTSRETRTSFVLSVSQ